MEQTIHRNVGDAGKYDMVAAFQHGEKQPEQRRYAAG